jgi:HD-GYP domain-containing protein (c-di-GMP phosphodiesterase class II)
MTNLLPVMQAQNMTIEDSLWVDVGQLRIGLYIELDVGWMSHPFPTGSFKISSQKQIETLRGLGLARIRSIPSKSDPDPAAEQLAAQARAQAALREKELRRQRAADLAAQDRALVVCERRFGESVRLYRKTMDLVQTQPKLAAEQCQAMVGTYVCELMDKGEASIRLLSEAAGDKSSMHPVNVTIVSLLLGKAMGLDAAELQDLGMAAFLHDIGKVKVPDRVRWVEESFSTAEYRMYQEHVAQGVLLGRAMELRPGALLALAQHHELADGSGFPARIKGESMSVGG